MIHVISNGDILSSGLDAIMNPVNCVGVMGGGLAKRFKDCFPGNFLAYVSCCKEGGLRPGRSFIFETGTPEPPRIIINFPTKDHWRNKSRLEFIEHGLKDLVSRIGDYDIGNLGLPALGCGLGGLDWRDVKPVILDHLTGLKNLDVYIFEPR